MKGVLRELGVELGARVELGPLGASEALGDLLHTGRRTAIVLDGQRLGVMGEVHPRLIKSWKLKKQRPIYLELDADALLFHGENGHMFDEPPEWQPIVRSLAFGLPSGFEAGRVAELLNRKGPDWLLDVAVTDLFVPPDEEVRAVTYKLVFANDPKDKRSADSVNEVCESLVTAVHQHFGNRGVQQR